MRKYVLADWTPRHGGPLRRDYYGDWRAAIPLRLLIAGVLLTTLAGMWFSGVLASPRDGAVASSEAGPAVRAACWSCAGLLACGAVLVPLSAMRRHLMLQWDPRGKLTVRLANPWPVQKTWPAAEIGGLVFGVREQIEYLSGGKQAEHKWYWYIYLVGKPGSATGRTPHWAEFLVECQQDPPGGQRAQIPPKTMELVTWLKRALTCPVRGPVITKAAP